MQRKHPTLIILMLFLVSCLPLIGGCSPGTPTVTSTPHPTNTSTPFSTATPTGLLHTPVPIPARPLYHLVTSFDYDRHFLTVDQTIIYPNHTDGKLDSLTLAVAANLCLTQNIGQIATREDFFRILDVHTDVDYSDILRRYFRNR